MSPQDAQAFMRGRQQNNMNHTRACRNCRIRRPGAKRVLSIALLIALSQSSALGSTGSPLDGADGSFGGGLLLIILPTVQ